MVDADSLGDADTKLLGDTAKLIGGDGYPSVLVREGVSGEVPSVLVLRADI